MLSKIKKKTKIPFRTRKADIIVKWVRTRDLLNALKLIHDLQCQTQKRNKR